MQMHWDWQNRTLKLSVGELSRFTLMVPMEEGGARWRAELGTKWHEQLRTDLETEDNEWKFEQPVAGVLRQGNWTFQLQGRMDQVKDAEEGSLIREVKTVSRPLPAEDEQLRSAYPHYFHQALLYAFLHGDKQALAKSTLLFVDIESGLTQEVPMGDEDLENLHDHLSQVVQSLEERRAHFRALRQLSVVPPFEQWREGQEEARSGLAATIDSAQTVLFEAPTGFGKTAILMEQALTRLARGEMERILFLTGKNTGHTVILDHLLKCKEISPELSVHALRSRQDHTVDFELENEFSRGEILQRWMASGLSAPGLLRAGILSLEDVRELGERHGLPPWAVSRILLPYADVWIADFNYLFDPLVSRMIESLATFDSARTFLIVDEAHNLPGRTAASHSHLLDEREVNRVLTEVQFARFPGKLSRSLDQLCSLLKGVKPCDSAEGHLEADLTGILREVNDHLSAGAFGLDELSPEARDWLWNLSWILADWDHPQLPLHTSCPGKGKFLISCLDASAVIGPVLRKFHRSVLMSATLQPWGHFIREIGMEELPQPEKLSGVAPWIEGCFSVVVDARVDTRFRARDRYFDVTARAIGDSSLNQKDCIAVFFPSYRYAESVLERLGFLYPAVRAEIQPRDRPLEEQQAFLENALLLDNVIFLVLGSRFSEGIDLLGGRISRAIVVSPALPEVNGPQKARESLVPGGSQAAFQTTYLVPAMRKISQALGRLVRSPEHHAQVLLHGKRFMEPAYTDLLPPYLQPLEHIITDEDFVKKWLQR